MVEIIERIRHGVSVFVVVQTPGPIAPPFGWSFPTFAQAWQHAKELAGWK
jgi:hypothetical protein